jgi:cytochrome c peroxidase
VRVFARIAIVVASLGASPGLSPWPAAAGMATIGDDRSGYERQDFRSNSRRVESTGVRADLLARILAPPLGLPRLSADVPTRTQIDLGRRLFFDRRLSVNGTLSCAMCHVPEQAFTQLEQRTPVGLEGQAVRRNAPSLFNVGYRPLLFQDGREFSLELQIFAPLLAANEMGNVSIGSVLERIRSTDDYDARFREAFGAPVTVTTLGSALAAYQRGLLSANAPFDRWRFAGDAGALSASAQRGFALFETAGCASCHTISASFAHFTDDDFHDTGIGFRAAMQSEETVSRLQIAPGTFVELAQPARIVGANDLGRYEVTGDPQDRWKYRTPSLRNVALTPPYMHDGSLPTLTAVIDHYRAGGVPHDGLDPLIKPLDLDAQDSADLIAFLESLTGDDVATLIADARSAPIGDF